MNRPSTAKQSLDMVLAGRNENSIEQCGTSTFQEVVRDDRVSARWHDLASTTTNGHHYRPSTIKCRLDRIIRSKIESICDENRHLTGPDLGSALSTMESYDTYLMLGIEG
jgi:hypothetical protein